MIILLIVLRSMISDSSVIRHGTRCKTRLPSGSIAVQKGCPRGPLLVLANFVFTTCESVVRHRYTISRVPAQYYCTVGIHAIELYAKRGPRWDTANMGRAGGQGESVHVCSILARQYGTVTATCTEWPDSTSMTTVVSKHYKSVCSRPLGNKRGVCYGREAT